MNRKIFLMMIALGAVLIFLFSSFEEENIETKDIVGSWSFGTAENRTVMINTERIFAVANYDLHGKKFMSSYGGTWRVEDNKLIKKIEWNSKDTAQVGKEITEEIQITGGCHLCCIYNGYIKNTGTRTIRQTRIVLWSGRSRTKSFRLSYFKWCFGLKRK